MLKVFDDDIKRNEMIFFYINKIIKLIYHLNIGIPSRLRDNEHILPDVSPRRCKDPLGKRSDSVSSIYGEIKER